MLPNNAYKCILSHQAECARILWKLSRDSCLPWRQWENVFYNLFEIFHLCIRFKLYLCISIVYIFNISVMHFIVVFIYLYYMNMNLFIHSYNYLVSIDCLHLFLFLQCIWQKKLCNQLCPGGVIGHFGISSSSRWNNQDWLITRWGEISIWILMVI